jgi:chromosome segregation ATPase
MNKNTIIFILVVATLIGSIWGSVANRKKIDLERKLNETVAGMKKLAESTAQEQEQVLGKTVGLQESIEIKDRQIDKARKELIALRKETQALEARLSEYNATVQSLTGERDECLRDLRVAREELAGLGDSLRELEAAAAETEVVQAAREPVKQEEGNIETGGPEIELLRDRLRTAESTASRQKEQLDAANAQITGLEKIVVEKTDALEAAGREMDRLRINMDVLLAKIADQQEKLRETQEKSRALSLELSARNDELAELRRELERPVPEQ